MKKQTLILLAVAAIAFGSVSSAFAYYTGEETHTNAVTVGQNTTTITEKFDPPTKLKTGENTYKKTVQITNTGNTDTFIRVFLDVDDDAIRKITGITSRLAGYLYRRAMRPLADATTTPPS